MSRRLPNAGEQRVQPRAASATHPFAPMLHASSATSRRSQPLLVQHARVSKHRVPRAAESASLQSYWSSTPDDLENASRATGRPILVLGRSAVLAAAILLRARFRSSATPLSFHGARVLKHPLAPTAQNWSLAAATPRFV